MDSILRDARYLRAATLPVPAEGPFALTDHDASVSAGPYYLVSPQQGRWLTIVETHFALRGVPPLSEIGSRLSATLSCYALTLVVHDDDVLFYNLDRDGKSLDGYNSYPQYFEQARLSDAEIAEQRHSPEAFQALLPAHRSLDELRSLLNRGWWNAYDSGNLDENGVATDEGDSFVFEGERMTALGTLLQLHGNEEEYPYSAWGESQSIRWPEFIALRYKKQP
jgi:hypothetical protein